MTTLPSATPAKIFIFTVLEEEANMVFSRTKIQLRQIHGNLYEKHKSQSDFGDGCCHFNFHLM